MLDSFYMGVTKVNGLDIIDELFYGNITPNERTFVRDSEYGQALEQLTEAEDALRGVLDKEDREALDRLTGAQQTMDAIATREYFTDGFRLGAKLMLDILTGKSNFIDIAE